MAIFLTETDKRHSLLYKQKHFRDKTQTKLISNSSKLVGASSEAPIDIDDAELFGGETEAAGIPGLLREDSDENDLALANIPSVDDTAGVEDDEPVNRRPKRGRHQSKDQQAEEGEAGHQEAEPIEVDDSEDELFVSNDSDLGSDDDNSSGMRPPPSKRRKEKEPVDVQDGMDAESRGDGKKKMAMDISYDGFAIYGRVLCLVVKRRDGGRPRGGRGVAGPAGVGNKSQTGAGSQAQLGGQASMENWITSTQLAADAAEDAEGV